jgi:hypothetical protein
MCHDRIAPKLARPSHFKINGRSVPVHPRVGVKGRGIPVLATVSPETHARLDAASKLHGVSLAEVARSIIESTVNGAPEHAC